MKTYGTILLMMTTILLVDVPVEAALSVRQPYQTETAAIKLFGKKRKGVKPRRGGLFNTGLFRKKNPCGCPGH